MNIDENGALKARHGLVLLSRSEERGPLGPVAATHRVEDHHDVVDPGLLVGVAPDDADLGRFRLRKTI